MTEGTLTKPAKAAEPTPRHAMRQAQPGLARQLVLGIEHQMPDVISGWLESLEAGLLTDEMVDVFVALGWLSSRQDPRLSPKTPTHA